MSEHPSVHPYPTPVDVIADRYVATIAALSPIAATTMGVPGHDHELDDFSPAGAQARADAARAVLRELADVEAVDDVDAVTVAAMTERLGVDLELFEAGEYQRDLNNIASPLQNIRDVFDLMPTDTPEDWAVVAARLEAIPGAIDGYIASLEAGAEAGRLPARRQVELAIAEAGGLADPRESFFTTWGTAGRPASLDAVAEEARAAYGRLAFALGELAPISPEADGVGRERYERFSRYFLGAAIDLEETYAWGLEELASIVADQEATAAIIAGPGATVAQAIETLNADPARRLHGTEALREWMQGCADGAIEALGGTHFDIPGPVRTIECCIAPTTNGGIYYTPPSEDFSRPGRMWWAVPAGVTQFATWQERTTVYHEGVPGHHLQGAHAIYRADVLNRWRRVACWVSGHGEGWALYAEKLMGELGFLEDPGDRLGMLDAQRMRATRVVLDIGVHLGLACPEQWGTGTWDAESAWRFLRANFNAEEPFVRFELNRYLGWPGQAPSYKVGQRLWEQLRERAAAQASAEGRTFDPVDFHRRALDVGSVGLDVLAQALA